MIFFKFFNDDDLLFLSENSMSTSFARIQPNHQIQTTPYVMILPVLLKTAV